MRDTALGIDIGTTSVKAVIADREGNVLFESSRPHDLVSTQAGYAEEDPAIWKEGVFALLREIGSTFDTSRIAGICFSGMVPTLIFLDGEGRPLYNSVQQNDARAVAEIDEWKNRLDEDSYFALTGNTVNQQVLFPKISWFRTHHPEVVAKAGAILGSYNYGAYLLTDELSVDTNWALESGMWRIREKSWDVAVLKAAGVPERLLPHVHESCDVVGATTERVRSRTGFPAGIPVVAGIADHVASAFSTGVREEGDLLLKLGGAGDILYATKALNLNRKLFIDYHPFEGTYLLNGCMASSGSIVKWLMGIMGLENFDRITPEAAKLPPGSEGLVLLPYFLGEKTPIFDVKARGLYFGLNLSHTRAHLFRAVLEAVAFGFMHHIETLRSGGCEVRRVFLSNGGARSPLWKEIVLDTIGHSGTYIADHPGSSMGAAFVALHGVGADPQWAALERFLERGSLIDYSPERHAKYEGYYALYRKLYETVKPLYAELADLAGAGR
jgi:xylulokinase